MTRERQERERPGAARAFLEWWRRVAKRIGDVQARLLLTFFYFAVLGPFAVVLRWATDPLGIKGHTSQSWVPKGEEKGSVMERATRQF